jgi:hypothetical protein
MLFTRTVAEKTKPGQRQDIEEKAYTFHAYGRTEGVAGVIVTDGDYPALVAHQLLGKIVDEFLAKHPRTAFSDPSLRENACPLPQLKEYIVKYQDPSQADSIMKIQQELDETKIVLHKTVCSYDCMSSLRVLTVYRSKVFWSAVRRLTPWFRRVMGCQLKARCSIPRYVNRMLPSSECANTTKPRPRSKTLAVLSCEPELAVHGVFDYDTLFLDLTCVIRR